MVTTLWVNLFGGPGAGKSTHAAGIFAALKRAGHNVELVTEYAKDLTWEAAHERLRNQAAVTGETLWRHRRLAGKVSAVISDSPLLMQAYWCRRNGFDGLALDVIRLSHQREFSPSFNIFVMPEEGEFSPIGRNEGETEARLIGHDIYDLMNREYPHPGYTLSGGHRADLSPLVTEIERRIFGLEMYA